MSDSAAAQLNALANPRIAPVSAEPLLDPKVFPNTSDVYFWNSSLPQQGNMVCYSGSTTWHALTKACCPPELGIYTPTPPSACRLRNTDAVANYFANCTRELAPEYISHWTEKDWK